MDYVMVLDKMMVTEFNDILIVCFTLGMRGRAFIRWNQMDLFLGVFATVGQQVYKDGKNMWDNLVNVPQGIDRKDF